MSDANDIRAAKLLERVQSYRKSCKKLQEDAGLAARNETKCGKTYAKLANQFKLMAENETYSALSKTLAEISKALGEIETHRSHLVVERFKMSMIEKTKELDEQCNKPTKVVLKDRTQSNLNAQKFREQYHQLASRNMAHEKVDKKQKQMKVEEKRVQNIDKTLEQTMIKYENKRVEDSKYILEDFLRSQIYLHCRSIELLTRAYKTLDAVSSEEAVREMAKEMRFSLHSLNLDQLLDYNSNDKDII